ncbi:cytochrome P450 [Streptomyces flaveolus]|uniref:cytochrome P450 n=1 Tax=Streptomyces flaveolus TaxID=67297 RepID=UPI00339DF632
MITTAPHRLPFIGHTHHLRDPLRFIRILQNGAPLTHIHLGGYPMIYIADPELIHEVLVNDHIYDRGGLFFDRVEEFLGLGLGNVLHQDHRPTRRAMQPHFTQKKTLGYHDIIQRHADELTKDWKPDTPIDIFSEVQRTLVAITLELFFGAPFSAEEVDAVVTAMEDQFANVLYRMAAPPLLRDIPTKKNRKFKAGRSYLIQFTRDQVSKHSGKAGIIAHLKEAGLDHDTIADNARTLLFAGSEATGSTTCWALMFTNGSRQRLLATNPQEVERTIYEALRLYPSSWFLTRFTNQPTRLAGNPIPAGTHFAFSPYGVHHDPRYHRDPGTFDPDRWINPPTSHTFIPFAGGPRRCLGDNLTFNEVSQILTTIARQWNWRTTLTPPKATISIIPENVQLIVKPIR